MEYSNLSPMFIMDLANKVEQALWNAFPSSKYKNVRYYIEKWWIHEEDNFGNIYDENFTIYQQDDGNIDLIKTLHNIPNETLIRIASDLGVPTPGFLPVVPDKFKNIFVDQNRNAYHNFERAISNVYENPDDSITLAASALDGVMKTILAHDKLQEIKKESAGRSLSSQTKLIVNRISEMSDIQCPKEVVTLCGLLRGIGDTIERIRSDKATAHGKAGDEYVVDEPLWAALIVNTSATVGLFLWELFDKKYCLVEKENDKKESTVGKEAIDINDVPF